jgi:hypothetical protein
MNSTPTEPSNVQVLMCTYQLGVYSVHLPSATLMRTDLQRDIDPAHVQKIKESIIKQGILEKEELHAILVSDAELLPPPGTSAPVHDLQIIMISGQHRAQAVKDACHADFNSDDAKWACYLYKPGERPLSCPCFHC